MRTSRITLAIGALKGYGLTFISPMVTQVVDRLEPTTTLLTSFNQALYDHTTGLLMRFSILIFELFLTFIASEFCIIQLPSYKSMQG